MRNRYIVSYDAKRLRRVHRTMRGFGDALQYSAFRCDLSPAERVLLVEALTQVINHREDQVMLINLGPRDGKCRRASRRSGARSTETTSASPSSLETHASAPPMPPTPPTARAC